MRVVLIEASPWLALDGSVVTTRLAGGGTAGRAYNQRGFTDWRAGIAEDVFFSAGLEYGDAGFTGRAVSTGAKIRFMPSDGRLVGTLASYLWNGAPIEVRSTDDSLLETYVLEATGRVNDVSIADGALVFDISDLTEKLDEPILKATFIGTGGLEGPPEAEGRIKRRTWGRCRNIEGRVLNVASNVYEFGDPAFPWYAIDVLSDKGRPGATSILAWQGSIQATFDALKASTPANGGGIVAPSIACAKWWTVPAGPLTADVFGEVGALYVHLPAQIASRVVAAVGGPAFEATTLAAAETAKVVTTGIHVEDDSETASNVLDRLLLPLMYSWKLNNAGQVELREITFASPVETLEIQDVERLESYKPIGTLKLGYRRNHRIHSDAEISAAILSAEITDLGELAHLNIADLGNLAVLDTVQLGSAGTVLRETGSPLTDAAAVTALGQAATVYGGGPFVTEQRSPTALFEGRPNLVRNGGLTLGFASFVPGNWQWFDAGGNEGPFAFCANAGTNPLYSVPFAAYASVTYTFQAVVSNTLTSGSLAVSVEWFGVSGFISESTQITVASGTPWGLVSISVTSPAGSTFMRVKIQTVGASGAGAGYIRRIKVNGDAIAAAFSDEATDGAALARSIGQVSGARNLAPISALNLGYKFTGAIAYTAAAGAPATATITVGAGYALIGDGGVSYNSMAVNVTGAGGSLVGFYLYVDDAAFAGGSRTLTATANSEDLFASRNRVFIGSIFVTFPTTGSGGGTGGGGSGGGSGGGNPLP